MLFLFEICIYPDYRNVQIIVVVLYFFTATKLADPAEQHSAPQCVRIQPTESYANFSAVQPLWFTDWCVAMLSATSSIRLTIQSKF